MFTSKKVFRGMAAVSAGFMLALGIWSSPAQAHSMTAYQGLDKAWITDNHYAVYVEDRECDNHGVFVVVNLSGGGGSTSVSDPDGCSGNTGYGSFSVPIASFYVCENTEGCGSTVLVQ